MGGVTANHAYPLLAALVKSAVVLGIILTITGWIVLLERRVIAFLQHRVGPNRAVPMLPGPFKFARRITGYFAGLGFFQPMADVLKLFTKEDFTPPFVNKTLFIMAPAIIVVTALLAFGLIPWGDPNVSPWYVISDANIGVLLFLALSSLGVYSIVLAGWSSNNKYSVIGGLRATAQMISYELSMGLSLLAIVMLSGSFNMGEIVRQQSPLWYVVLQPVGFLVFLVAVIAESRRTPFDLPEAENELVAGFHTEYSSMKFAMFFLGEYIGVLLLSGIISVMYLGGWKGPTMPVWLFFLVGAVLLQAFHTARGTRRSMAAVTPGVIVLLLLTLLFLAAALLRHHTLWAVFVPGAVWLLVKVFLIVNFFIWIRATYPRYRYDHLMDIGWKYLVPISLVNVMATGFIALALASMGWHR